MDQCKPLAVGAKKTVQPIAGRAWQIYGHVIEFRLTQAMRVPNSLDDMARDMQI